MNKNGFHCELSFLLDEADDRLMYSKGNYHKKAAILASSYSKRITDLRRANEFDIIFIFREALMTRSTYFEQAFSKSKAKLIYDFDDAIWMNDTSDANRLFSWMKKPSKIAKSISCCDLVFAGNEYLKAYASQFNEHVEVIPTTIDTHEYQKKPSLKTDEVVVIGWSGSITTIKHFEYAIPFLEILKKKYGSRIRIKVIGDGNYRNHDLEIQGIHWNKSSEIEELSSIDIGIMPLPDDPWARGKCGLKGLQYMALEIATVMSPVGVNTSIIQDGVNGYLATTIDEWVEKISFLIENHEQRKRMGAMARQTVVASYSVDALKSTYLHWFKSLTDIGE